MKPSQRKLRRRPDRIKGCVAVHNGPCEPHSEGSGEAPDSRLAQCPRCQRQFCMHEGGADSPLCDICWGRVGEKERGRWAGSEGWGKERFGGKFSKGFETGRADWEEEQLKVTR